MTAEETKQLRGTEDRMNKHGHPDTVHWKEGRTPSGRRLDYLIMDDATPLPRDWRRQTRRLRFLTWFWGVATVGTALLLLGGAWFAGSQARELEATNRALVAELESRRLTSIRATHQAEERLAALRDLGQSMALEIEKAQKIQDAVDAAVVDLGGSPPATLPATVAAHLAADRRRRAGHHAEIAAARAETQRLRRDRDQARCAADGRKDCG